MLASSVSFGHPENPVLYIVRGVYLEILVSLYFSILFLHTQNTGFLRTYQSNQN